MNIIELHKLVSAQCPIDGLDSDGEISFKQSATHEQRSAAEALVAEHLDSLTTEVTPTERVLNEARALRSKLLDVVDGLHGSALTKAILTGINDDAVAINTFKEGLRDITTIDLTGAASEAEMRILVRDRYKELAAAAPMSVQLEFLKAIK
ncbi:MAG: hypothetical protein V4718_04560 [Pseudomonadota bacterium]